MKDRLFEIQNDRLGGFFTEDLSRTDLIEIAKLLPAKNDWQGSDFIKIKADIQARYGIGSNKFSSALDRIQKNRETKALIGIESSLKYISDETIMFLALAFREQYPTISTDNKPKPFALSALCCRETYIEMERQYLIRRRVLEKLRLEDFADARTIFYFGRDRELPETYEKVFDRDLARLTMLDSNSAEEEMVDVFTKINFLFEFKKGLRALGRASLADSLEMPATN